MSSFILICLGNKGDEYKYMRHNFGFILADYISQKTSQRFKKINFGEYTYIKEFKKELYVFKGETYMNLSGITAKKFLDYLSLEDYQVGVAYDDMDIPFGKVKISVNGGPGGHKGVKSIIENIGKDNIRIRLGIGKGKDAVDHVLSNFSKEEMEKIPKILDMAFEAIKTILNENVEKAMSLFNSKTIS